MKKLTMAFVVLLCAANSNAQFEETRYLAQSLKYSIDFYSTNLDVDGDNVVVSVSLEVI